MCYLSFPAPVKLQTGERDHQLFGSKRYWIVGCSINVFLFGLASLYYLLTKFIQMTYINPEKRNPAFVYPYIECYTVLCLSSVSSTGSLWSFFTSHPSCCRTRLGISSTDGIFYRFWESNPTVLIELSFNWCLLSPLFTFICSWWGAETNSAATWHVCSLFICT